MAISFVRQKSELGSPWILAPERYDPRRSVSASSSCSLGELVDVVRGSVQPSVEIGACLVLDTSDAREGLVVSRRACVRGEELGSAKKAPCPGDVIISRLRPYLRQVAYVDDGIPHAEGKKLLCSTEFYVLRARPVEPSSDLAARASSASIAFLVPFLLCPEVQAVLAAAQEGGHHPRFNEATLTTLAVPRALVEQRAETSRSVQLAVREFRRAEARLDAATQTARAATARAWKP